MDLDYITFKYKQKSKEVHPDVEGGNADSFKELNHAFEEIQDELGRG